MKESLNVSKSFLIGIVISALAFSVQVLDATLTARFVAFSVFAIISVWLIFRSKPKLTIEVDITNGTYFLFAAFCTLSIAWANTRSEAIFESSKVLLSLAAFSIAGFCLKHTPGYFTHWLYRFSIVIFFIGSFIAVYQFNKIPVLTKESLYSVSSIHGHKNLYASFLFLNLFFLIRASLTFKGFFRIAAYIAIAFTLVILLFIKTKAVWIGMLFAGIIFVVLYVSKKIKIKLRFYIALGVSIVLVNLFFAYVVPVGIQKGISHNIAINNASTQEEKTQELDNERLMLWHKTYAMIAKHPLAGVGMGNWQIHFPDATLNGIWRAEDLNFTFQRPHNDLLWILSETGWIGLNLFFAFILSLLLFLMRGIRTDTLNLRSRVEMMLYVAFIVGYFCISFFDFPKERMEHNIWLNVLFAMAYRANKDHANIVQFQKIKISRSGKAGILFVLMAIGVVGVLRYRGEYYIRQMYNERVVKQDMKAIRWGNKALSFAYCIDPTSVPILWYTGNSYANLGNYEKAQSDFIAAYSHNPYNRNVLNDLGSSYALSKNTDLAKKYYEEALRISPRFDDPKLNLAAIYIQEKNFAKADTCLKTMFKDSEKRNQYQKMVDAFNK